MPIKSYCCLALILGVMVGNKAAKYLLVDVDVETKHSERGPSKQVKYVRMLYLLTGLKHYPWKRTQYFLLFLTEQSSDSDQCKELYTNCEEDNDLCCDGLFCQPRPIFVPICVKLHNSK